MRTHALAGIALLLLCSACDNQKITSNAPTVIADPNAPAGKTRATALNIKSSAGVGDKTCYEDGGGLEVRPVDRQSSMLVNHNTGCTWRAILAAYGVPPGATDTAQQHWLAGVYYEIEPRQSKLMDVAYSPCRDQWTVRFQTDVWALRNRPNDTDQPLPKQYGQDGVGLHEFGGHEWDTEDCPAPSYPPQTPPVAPPVTPPPPPPADPPAPTCPADGSITFPPETWLMHNGEPDYHATVGPVSVTIPAATWRIVVTTTDDHQAKPGQSQLHEQALVQFFRAGDQLPVGQLGPTIDIPDNADTQVTDLGILSLPNTGSLAIVHAGPADGVDSFMIQSVTWQCVRPIPASVTRQVQR